MESERFYHERVRVRGRMATVLRRTRIYIVSVGTDNLPALFGHENKPLLSKYVCPQTLKNPDAYLQRSFSFFYPRRTVYTYIQKSQERGSRVEQEGGQGLDAGGPVRGGAGARRPSPLVRQVLAQGRRGPRSCPYVSYVIRGGA